MNSAGAKRPSSSITSLYFKKRRVCSGVQKEICDENEPEWNSDGNIEGIFTSVQFNYITHILSNISYFCTGIVCGAMFQYNFESKIMSVDKP